MFRSNRGMLRRYEKMLKMEEKCPATVKKYVRHVKKFLKYLGGARITKVNVMQYKMYINEVYDAVTVNNQLAAVNGFLCFIGKEKCIVKHLVVQRQSFANAGRELTIEEYQRLLKAAGDHKIAYILQTIAATGIRVSELEYITAEAVRTGEAVVDNKNKIRHIILSKQLCGILSGYMQKQGITSGSVFVTRNGKPLDRSYIWKLMKGLCKKAGVSPEKVFPHNLRHLFARTYYSQEKDIAKLADILGHSNIQTTRIYTCESGEAHREGLERVHKALLI